MVAPCGSLPVLRESLRPAASCGAHAARNAGPLAGGGELLPESPAPSRWSRFTIRATASVAGSANRFGGRRTGPGTFGAGGVALHVAIASTTCRDAQHIGLKRLVDAHAMRGVLHERTGFDLPPFAGNADAPLSRIVH